MANQKNHLANYLQHYAEPAIDELLPFVIDNFSDVQPFEHCLVIPAYNESHQFILALLSKLESKAWHHTLIIIVVNQPDDDSDATKNMGFWQNLQQLAPAHNLQVTGHELSQDIFLTLDHKSSCSRFILLDFFSPSRRLARKKGVGLARKIACDLACLLYRQQHITVNWIHTSDADTNLPDNYFQQTAALDTDNTSAAIYDFAHTGKKNTVTESTQLYEESINYYVEGLRYAKSPYAYHTLGSCIAINMDAYIRVRGFTKRAGGEDFYCLNKLAKVGKIKQLKGNKLIIASRVSARVPFGTGPAVAKIMDNGESQSTLLSYNPLVFLELTHLLLSFENLFKYKDKSNVWLSQQSKAAQSALESLHIDSLLKHIRLQVSDDSSAMIHIHQWFDAFKTLRFIHLLEPNHPKIDLQRAKKQLSQFTPRA